MYNPVVIRSNRCEDFEGSKQPKSNLNSRRMLHTVCSQNFPQKSILEPLGEKSRRHRDSWINSSLNIKRYVDPWLMVSFRHLHNGHRNKFQKVSSFHLPLSRITVHLNLPYIKDSTNRSSIRTLYWPVLESLPGMVIDGDVQHRSYKELFGIVYN